MWPKEKLLIMSNCSFGNDIFKSRLLLLHQNASAGGKGLKEFIKMFSSSSFHNVTIKLTFHTWLNFFPTYRRILTHLQQLTFSIFSSNYTYIYRDFPYFWVDILKIIWCRIVVCGKGLFSCFENASKGKLYLYTMNVFIIIAYTHITLDKWSCDSKLNSFLHTTKLLQTTLKTSSFKCRKTLLLKV